MAKMNKVMNPEQMSRVTQQFTQEHMKLGITDDMSMFFFCKFSRLIDYQQFEFSW